MQVNSLNRAEPRRGVVLLVVLAMLTLFAVVAITFVMFSDQQALSARFYAIGENKSRPDPDLLLGFALNQIVHDTPDPASAMRGHGLLRNMYGNSMNALAYSGSGKLANSNNDQFFGVGYDPRYFINYTGMRSGIPDNATAYGGFNPAYTYPDHNAPWLGAIASRHAVGGTVFPNVVLSRPWVRVVKVPIPTDMVNYPNGIMFNPFDPAWSDYMWKNGTPPAMYWDTNPPAGSPVGYRPINPAANAYLVALPALSRQQMVMRPSPAIHTNFPIPEDKGGDVRNLPPGMNILIRDGTKPGGVDMISGNDSYWADFNFPVQKLPGGGFYKPLFAIFTMDMDGKLNVNMHMNDMGDNNSNAERHLSGHGLGPWEIGPQPPGYYPAGPELAQFAGEYARLLRGKAAVGAYPALSGRFQDNIAGQPYGFPLNQSVPRNIGDSINTKYPGITPQLPTIQFVGPTYSLTDITGSNDVSPVTGGALLPFSKQRTYPLSLPGQALPPTPIGAGGNLPNWYSFPRYPLGYDNSFDVAAGNLTYGILPSPFLMNPRGSHPLLTSPYTSNPDRRMSAAHMDWLLRMGDTNTDSHKSELLTLLPQTWGYQGNPAPVSNWLYNRMRWMLTTDSHDRASYGNPTGAVSALTPSNYSPSAFPGHKFDFLNQAYINNYPATEVSGRIDLTNPANLAAFQAATQERQNRALALYNIGITTLNSAMPTDAEKRALAQLAVNIVDYLDPDDYFTPFSPGNDTAGTAIWVYGTELPRIVVNEAYTEHDPSDGTNRRGTVWVELQNPLLTDTILKALNGEANFAVPQTAQPTPGGIARLWMNDTAPMANDGYAVYQLVLAQDLEKGQDNRGSTGEPLMLYQYRPGPMAALQDCILSDWTDTNNAATRNQLHYVMPSNGNYSGILSAGVNAMTGILQSDFSRAPDKGFYMVGGAQFPANAQPAPDAPVPTRIKNELTYEQAIGMNTNPDNVTILLRRLMYPSLPPNIPASMTYDPTLPDNVYITVDYVVMKPNMQNQIPSGNGNPPVDQRQAWGRKQTYAAYETEMMAQNPDAVPDPMNLPMTLPRNQPRHTFYRHNSLEELDYRTAPVPPTDALGLDNTTSPPTSNPSTTRAGQTLTLPFDWLVHMDRPLTTPMELLHVSAVRPHELTQKFIATYTATSTDVIAGGSLTAPVFTTVTYTAPAGMPAIQVGTPLLVDTGANQETVIPVTVTGTNQFSAYFTMNHDGSMTPFNIRVVQTDYRPYFFDSSKLLHRFFEFVECRPLHQWANTGSPALWGGQGSTEFAFQQPQRRAGRMNINTMFEEELFHMWANLPTSYQAHLSQTWANVRNSRDGANWPINPLDGSMGYPFWSPGSLAMNDTWMRPGPRGAHLLEIVEPGATNANYNLPPTGAGHPFVRGQLLSKLNNTMTTRSNVFAVWMTVGYFNCDSTGTVLGAELGRSEGNHIRHRMFSIIDRSVYEGYIPPGIDPATGSPAIFGSSNYYTLQNYLKKYDPRRDYGFVSTVSSFAPAFPPLPVGSWMPTPMNIVVTPVSGGMTGIEPGAILLIDGGQYPEMVVVTSVTNTTFTASFSRVHSFNPPVRPPPTISGGSPASVLYWTFIE